MNKANSPVPSHRAIAQAVGTAASTVSLALRNDPRVAEKTAARIRAAAQKMGYRANPSVSMWMAHVRSTRSPRFQEAIAYIHTIPPEHSYRRYVPFDLYRRGAGERAKRLGYQRERAKGVKLCTLSSLRGDGFVTNVSWHGNSDWSMRARSIM